MRSAAAGSLSSLLRVELGSNFQSNRRGRRRPPSASYIGNSLGGRGYIAIAAIAADTDWAAWRVVGSLPPSSAAAVGDLASPHVIFCNQLLHIILVLRLCRAYTHSTALKLCVLLCICLLRRVSTVPKTPSRYRGQAIDPTLLMNESQE